MVQSTLHSCLFHVLRSRVPKRRQIIFIGLVAFVLVLHVVFRSHDQNGHHVKQEEEIEADQREFPVEKKENQGQDTNSRQKTLFEDRKMEGNEKCKSEKFNFVYIKMIKCASETLSSMFRRFGYIRNLSQVLPVQEKIYIGWPYQIESGFYRQNKSKEFNIFLDHAVYNHTILTNMMAPGSVFITSLREPYRQFKSMFHYYNLKGVTQMAEDIKDPVTEYLSNLSHYESLYKAHRARKRYCIPDNLSMTRNLMSFNLGFPTGYPPGSPDLSHDQNAISNWLDQLEKEFLVIILVEYLDESLVLLKRLMCWQMKDILYQSRNIGGYKAKESIDSNNYNIYKNWSNVDFQLYERFQRVFWKSIGNQGVDFMEEVAHFKTVNSQVLSFCEGQSNVTPNSTLVAKQLKIPASVWNKEFVFTNQDCGLLKSQLSDEVKLKYDNQAPSLPQSKPRLTFC